VTSIRHRRTWIECLDLRYKNGAIAANSFDHAWEALKKLRRQAEPRSDMKMYIFHYISYTFLLF